jgi:hypothetical protein
MWGVGFGMDDRDRSGEGVPSASYLDCRAKDEWLTRLTGDWQWPMEQGGDAIDTSPELADTALRLPNHDEIYINGGV